MIISSFISLILSLSKDNVFENENKVIGEKIYEVLDSIYFVCFDDKKSKKGKVIKGLMQT